MTAKLIMMLVLVATIMPVTMLFGVSVSRNEKEMEKRRKIDTDYV